MKKRYTEEQIAHALRQVEAGEVATDVCRKMGVSEQTFYRWKKKYAGMGVAELRRLRQLEEENRRLEQLGPVFKVESPGFKCPVLAQLHACVVL